MTPKFLRDEAARFRGMADTADRESSKQRLLAMAVDYESRAMAAGGVSEPEPDAAVVVTPDTADTAVVVQPAGPVVLKLARKTARGLKDPASTDGHPA
jgi:hypothetical protein